MNDIDRAETEPPMALDVLVVVETDDDCEIVRRLRIVGKGWQEAIRQAERTIAERVADVNSGPKR